MQTVKRNNTYLKDKIVNIILTSKETRRYTESIIAKALDIPMYIVKDNLELVTPRINNNINRQYSVVDALYENNTSIINIEVNYVKHKRNENKNMKYICQLLLRQTKINDKEYKLKPIYQININNYDVFNENRFIYKSYLMEESLHKKRDDLINIIDINVDFLKDMDYTEIMKGENSLEKLLYILVCNDEMIINKLCFGDDIMEKVIDKIFELTEDDWEELYYDPEEILKEYSFDKGVEKGIEQGKKEIAKIMLEKNMSIEEVIEITNLTLEEVNEIKNK